MRAERFQVGGAVQQRFRTEANELRRRTVLRQKWRIPPPGWDSERLTKDKQSLESPAKQRRITNSLVSAGFAWQAAIFSVIGCGEGRGGRDKSHQRERERAALEIPLGAKLIGEGEREGERRRERRGREDTALRVFLRSHHFNLRFSPLQPSAAAAGGVAGRSVGRSVAALDAFYQESTFDESSTAKKVRRQLLPPPPPPPNSFSRLTRLPNRSMGHVGFSVRSFARSAPGL